MNIKAIQTQYKGYHFRSRLEARWAVFFDACGYQWEYEPEGFDLGDGVYYLPDFKIYGVDDNGDDYIFWIEIKPDGKNLSDLEIKKIESFKSAVWDNAYSRNGKLIKGYGDYIVIEGMPERGKMHEGTLMTGVDGSWWVLDPVYRGRPSFWERDHDFEFLNWPAHPDNYIAGYGCPYDKARSARFEHGESGATL